MTSTVKCLNCNVVINELLAFLQNVLDFMDEDSIHQLCTTSFTNEDVVRAKSLLCDSLPNAKKIRRKNGKKKMSRDLEDIIGLMKNTNCELFPIFVAKELHKLPPVTLDHIDSTRLVRDIIKLQTQFRSFQENVVTVESFELLRQEVEGIKNAPVMDNYCMAKANINRRRGACLRDSLDSGPIGLQYVPVQTSIASAEVSTCNNNNNKVSNSLISAVQRSPSPALSIDQSISFTHHDECETAHRERVEAATAVPNANCANRCAHTQEYYSSIYMNETTHQASAGREARTPAVDCVEAPLANTAVSNRSVGATGSPVAATAVTAARDSFGWQERPDARVDNSVTATGETMNVLQRIPNYGGAHEESEWIMARSKSAKRYKLIGQKGRASVQCDSKFKAADSKVPLFISNVSVDTSEDDIASYIRDKTAEIVTLKKINLKYVNNYSAFKVFVSKRKLDLFLDDNLWPDGITFRRFVYFKYGPNVNSLKSSNMLTN